MFSWRQGTDCSACGVGREVERELQVYLVIWVSNVEKCGQRAREHGCREGSIKVLTSTTLKVDPDRQHAIAAAALEARRPVCSLLQVLRLRGHLRSDGHGLRPDDSAHTAFTRLSDQLLR